MFGLGMTELLVLVFILVIIFGASKIPELGAGIGKGIQNFKKAMKEPNEIDVTPKKPEEKVDSANQEKK
jgi:sec-independent protein translocase protein TatA